MQRNNQTIDETFYGELYDIIFPYCLGLIKYKINVDIDVSIKLHLFTLFAFITENVTIKTSSSNIKLFLGST